MSDEMNRVVEKFEKLCKSDDVVNKAYDSLKNESIIFNAMLLSYAIRMYVVEKEANEKLHQAIRDFVNKKV